MHTQTGETGQIWRNIGRLEASVSAIRREMNQMRRDMRDSKARAGWPLWVHLTAMAVISAMSAFGLIRPDTALSIMRMMGKAFAG